MTIKNSNGRDKRPNMKDKQRAPQKKKKRMSGGGAA